MGRKKITIPKAEIIEEVKTEEKKICKSGKYKFKNTYIGKYGRFNNGKVYELTEEEANIFVNDIIEV